MTTPRARQPDPESGAGELPDPLFAPLRDALKPVYQLLRRLGEGGMGAVYLAREPSLKRDVAVKVMLPWLAKDATARARFEREAQSVAAITHPNVINVYGTGELPDGTPYFIMQYVGGRSLADRLSAEGPLALREARRVLAEVAAGLAAAHQRGIIHRDIKAANILQDAETGRVIVTDFGIAAVRDGTAADRKSSGARLTQPDVGTPGTVDYMAPEQLLGEETTEASDVYSFGLLAYELLSGSGPFRATSPHEMAAAHLRDDPKPLSAHREDVDAEMEHLVASCLAKQPAERPSSASLVQRLPPGDVLALEWPPPGLELLRGRLPRMTRRLGLGSALLATALLAIILADPEGGPVLPMWLLVLLAIAGAGLVLVGAGATSRALYQSRRATRSGYGWLPVMEVVADNRGDTGALITGLREYAALPRAVRNRLRAQRLIAAACAFGAAVAPLPALAFAVRGAAAGHVAPSTTGWIVVLPSLLLLVVAAALRARENRLARRRATRPARRRRMDIAAPVVQAWNESFERARTGQPLGSRAPSPLVIRVAIATLLLLLVVAALAFAPIMVLPAIGNYVASWGVPKFSNTRGRVLRAEAGRPWVSTRDGAIAPAAAGQAFQALLFAGFDRYEPEFLPPQRRLARFLPSPLDPVLERLLYGGPRTQDSLFTVAAQRAFTPETRAQLERIASHPDWDVFRTAARAPKVDLVSTRYRPAVLDTGNWWSFPLPRFGSAREPMIAAGAVAALRVSQGRNAEAELMLRDALGYGLNLVDNGVFMIETIVGTNIALQALDRLEAFFAVTGRAAEAQRLRAAREQSRSRQDELIALEDARLATFASNPLGVFRRATLELLRDSTMPPTLRWEFARLATDLPCFNARELVYGPGADVDSSLAIFRRQVVRTASDSLWLRVTTDRSRRLSMQPIPAALIGAYSTALGNQQLRHCLPLLIGMF